VGFPMLRWYEGTLCEIIFFVFVGKRRRTELDRMVLAGTGVSDVGIYESVFVYTTGISILAREMHPFISGRDSS
jgi:hypothetical protein